MAQYPSVVVTDKGHDLISTANATNKAVTYIKAVIGDGQLNNQSIESLTAMISPKLELPLSMGVDLGDGQWRISFALSNSTLTNGFYAREVGVFAKLDGQDDSTAILFGYTNGGNYVDYIPPKTTPIDSQVFNCDFVIGDAENVTVNILDGTFVTHQALTNAIDIHNTATDSHQPITDMIAKITGEDNWQTVPTHNLTTVLNDSVKRAVDIVGGRADVIITPLIDWERIKTENGGRDARTGNPTDNYSYALMSVADITSGKIHLKTAFTNYDELIFRLTDDSRRYVLSCTYTAKEFYDLLNGKGEIICVGVSAYYYWGFGAFNNPFSALKSTVNYLSTGEDGWENCGMVEIYGVTYPRA